MMLIADARERARAGAARARELVCAPARKPKIFLSNSLTRGSPLDGKNLPKWMPVGNLPK